MAISCIVASILMLNIRSISILPSEKAAKSDAYPGSSVRISSLQNPAAFEDLLSIDKIAIASPKVNELEIRNVTDKVQAYLNMNEKFKPQRWQEMELRQGSIFFVTGRASCAILCAQAIPGCVCARDWFPHINNSGAIRAAFDTACTDLFGSGAPWQAAKGDFPPCTALPADGEAFICPCATAPRAAEAMAPTGSGLAALQRVMLRRMEELHQAGREAAGEGGWGGSSTAAAAQNESEAMLGEVSVSMLLQIGNGGLGERWGCRCQLPQSILPSEIGIRNRPRMPAEPTPLDLNSCPEVAQTTCGNAVYNVTNKLSALTLALLHATPSNYRDSQTGRVGFFVGRHGQSCIAVCSREGLQCSPRYARMRVAAADIGPRANFHSDFISRLSAIGRDRQDFARAAQRCGHSLADLTLC